jgi:UDP-N-acetylmuramoyl-tripeptide--D-alanyl-D-alanine ligase
MKTYSIKQLAEIIGADFNQQHGSVSSVSTDSRNIKPGDCFFAIEGENFDGHAYLEKAFSKGASCAVINKWFPISDGYRDTVLGVVDPVEALGKLAACYRNDCDFKVIAITGSVGKTTTRHIIAHVLSSKYKVHQSPKNFNNEIGLPLTLLGADPDTDIIVAELGANNPGEIASLSNIAAPDIAVVTNVHPSHLEGFGSIETIIEEKLSIAAGLKSGGKFLLNARYRGLIESANQNGYMYESFLYDGQNILEIENITVKSPLAGRGNNENIVAGWNVCKEFDISPEEFARAIKSLPPVPMRSEIKQFGSITVIDDCYNANPASMKNALEILSSMASETNNRAVFVCGDMLELGEKDVEFHNQLSFSIVDAKVKLLLTAGSLSCITSDLVKSMANNDIDVYDFGNSDNICNNLDKFIKDNDIVLVTGSRSIGLEKVVTRLRELFDRTSLIGNKN